MTMHIIPSGFNKTLCGLSAREVKGSPLGMWCDCEECRDQAQALLTARLL